MDSGVINSPDYWAGKFGQTITVGEILGILGRGLSMQNEATKKALQELQEARQDAPEPEGGQEPGEPGEALQEPGEAALEGEEPPQETAKGND